MEPSLEWKKYLYIEGSGVRDEGKTNVKVEPLGITSLYPDP
jgi:hypothetical protein